VVEVSIGWPVATVPAHELLRGRLGRGGRHPTVEVVEHRFDGWPQLVGDLRGAGGADRRVAKRERVCAKTPAQPDGSLEFAHNET
jgi:hypothetical protein